MSRRLLAAAIGTAIGLSACAVGPDFHHPAAPSTDRYTAQPAPVAADGAQALIPGQDPPQMWWQQFGSGALNDLVSEALRANPTVESAEAALRQAQENVAAARGGYWPLLQLGAEASRNRDAVQVLSPTLTSGAAVFNLYSPEVSVSYVPDLFGANRRQVESLQAAADVSRDEYDAASMSLAANVVACAVQEAGLRAQVDATRQIIDSERESLQLMRRELELGAIAEADVMAQDAALAQLEASLPPLQKNLDQQRDLLAVLTGTCRPMRHRCSSASMR